MSTRSSGWATPWPPSGRGAAGGRTRGRVLRRREQHGHAGWRRDRRSREPQSRKIGRLALREYSLDLTRSTCSRRITSSPRSGTMVKGSPVEIVWIGRKGRCRRRADWSRAPRFRDVDQPEFWVPPGSSRRMSAGPGCPRSGQAPGRRSGREQLRRRRSRRARRKPCPAWVSGKGQLFLHVKMRTLTPRSRSMAGSRGRTKVVSERFISRARACMCGR